jgi:hypothetical protein
MADLRAALEAWSTKLDLQHSSKRI